MSATRQRRVALPVSAGPLQLASSARGGRCNCKNSRCLKLYCECFASGLYCNGCNCTSCCNNSAHEASRQEAVEATLERNPHAFRPKIASDGTGGELEGVARHNKGCHCKKSGCLKKYCECFQAGVLCTAACRCMDCKNFDAEAEGDAAAPAVRAGSAAAPRRAPQAPQAPPKRLRTALQPKAGEAAAAGAAVAADPPPRLHPAFSYGYGPAAGAGAAAPPAAPRSALSGLVKQQAVGELARLLVTAAARAAAAAEAAAAPAAAADDAPADLLCAEEAAPAEAPAAARGLAEQEAAVLTAFGSCLEQIASVGRARAGGGEAAAAAAQQ